MKNISIGKLTILILFIQAVLTVVIIVHCIAPSSEEVVITTEQIEQEELQEYEEERIEVEKDIADQLENTDYVLPVQ